MQIDALDKLCPQALLLLPIRLSFDGDMIDCLIQGTKFRIHYPHCKFVKVHGTTSIGVEDTENTVNKRLRQNDSEFNQCVALFQCANRSKY